MNEPLVAEIKRNALDDGPGIRSTVFFKGCPLRCVWCHNPECIRPGPELIFREERCIGSRTCVRVCPRRAVGPEGPAALDRSRCDLCGACVDACPPGALEMVGRRYSVEALVEELMRDEPFYRNSGGGVTFSGGEPTLYAEFAGAVARGLRERGVHVMIETCGEFDWARFDALLRPHLDLVWVDLKIADANEHRRRCGRDNARILANIERLVEGGAPSVLVRVPLVPGITATGQNLRAIASFLERLGVRRVGVLPYNPLWLAKARGLGAEIGYDREEWLTPEERAECRRALEGLEILGAL